MKDTDKAEFLETLEQVASYYGRNLPPIAVQVWWKTCSTLDIAQFKIGMENAIAQKDKMPCPSDIAELAGGENAKSEWRTVMSHLGRTQTIEEMPISERAKNAARAIGGLGRLLYMKAAEETWIGKEFEQEYKLSSQQKALPATKAEATAPELMAQLGKILEDAIK